MDALQVRGSDLTDREKRALLVLIDKREIYKANRNGVAARAMGVAIWLIWQVFNVVEVKNEL